MFNRRRLRDLEARISQLYQEIGDLQRSQRADSQDLRFLNDQGLRDYRVIWGLLDYLGLEVVDLFDEPLTIRKKKGKKPSV